MTIRGQGKEYSHNISLNRIKITHQGVEDISSVQFMSDSDGGNGYVTKLEFPQG